MDGIGIYYRETTFQQRKQLFVLADQLQNVSEACTQMKVSRKHYYHWKPRYDQEGIDGLRTPKSHAPQNPQTIDPQIEQRIIELKREHPKWGKKRIAQWIWKEHSWENVVAVNTVRNVLHRHGLWRNEKRKKTRKNKGVTADTPGKTINIDLCFVPAEEIEVDTPDVSFFFQQIDMLCSPCSINDRSVVPGTMSGLEIFSKEKTSYDEKMDAYVLMRSMKEERSEDNQGCTVEEMEKKTAIKQTVEEIRGWRRRIRIERRKEDEAWQKYRDIRKALIQKWKTLSRKKRNKIKEEKRQSDEEWNKRNTERKKVLIKREKEDEEWRKKQRGLKEQMNIRITSLAAILAILDNCTRKCIGLPVFMTGRKVSADDVIRALEERLPSELRYIISDNGKQFIAEAFQKLCDSRDIVQVKITRHRPATNGIAERFVQRLKEMLTEKKWINEEELKMVLNEIVNEYNDAPHQGLDGLSPNEYEWRIKCVPSA
ncbi:MAG: DDE-type integrase/transposase/recombinase [Thermoplasmata archaeon]|nr:DDE-type integrase/transposase/recombinase [Thermoplasmata archaeon]MBE3138961.1 DDE-type integrase/transposase/recombinase [Thermoplasmata archaeon]